MQNQKPPGGRKLRLVVSNTLVVVSKEQHPSPPLTLLQGNKQEPKAPPRSARVVALPTPKVVACADALEQAYHQARLLSPALTCLRVETGNIPGELLEAAALELERRGWTVTPVPTANFPNDEIATAHALWLKPYA